MSGPENGNFPLFYVVKMSLRRWVGGSKSLKTPLRNIKKESNKFFLNHETFRSLFGSIVCNALALESLHGIARARTPKAAVLFIFRSSFPHK